MDGVKKFFYTTNIEVPSGLQDIIPTLVALEAEKTIPFPLEAIVWNYRISPSEKKETFEVTYVAAHKEDLESSYHAALATGTTLETLCMNSDNDFELLAPSCIAARSQQLQQRFVEHVTALFSLLLVLCFFYLHYERGVANKAIAQASLLLEEEKKSAAASKEILTAAHELKKEATFLTNLVHERTAWIELLNELHQKLPPRYLWITQLSPIFEEKASSSRAKTRSSSSPKEDTSNTIVGLAIEGLFMENPHQDRTVDEWVENLKTSPLFDMKEKKKEDIVALWTMPDHTAYAYPFKLHLPLKQPLRDPTAN